MVDGINVVHRYGWICLAHSLDGAEFPIEFPVRLRIPIYTAQLVYHRTDLRGVGTRPL